jgi:hypothetical protein
MISDIDVSISDARSIILEPNRMLGTYFGFKKEKKKKILPFDIVIIAVKLFK